MHEDNNWCVYREELDQKIRSNSPFVPFLGVFLTTTAFVQAASSSRLKNSLSSMSLISSERKKSSENEKIYETYHLLEAITVRERLDKLRENSITLDSSGEKKNVLVLIQNTFGTLF